MTISSMPPGLRILPADLAQSGISRTGVPHGGFGDRLRDAIADVDNLQLNAQQKVTDLVQGNGGDVHDAMIAVEKADLSFQLMLQMRNKVVQAYQQIAGMQF